MNIFKFHILYWLMAFICAFTGLFKNFLFFSMLIIVHEFGHYITAKFFKWKVEKVVILPIGGITIFNEILSKSIFEEFIILIMGPLFQITFYFIYTIIFGYSNLLYSYNIYLLIFNMIPIYPMDGYKLLNLFFNKLSSFKFSHIVTMIISLFVLVTVFIISLMYKINLIFILALLIILVKNIKEVLFHELIFNKFLLERYLNNLKFKKNTVIKSDNLKKMKREYYHLFYFDKKYETEKDLLRKRFDNNRKIC